jgi:hypothetical protein
MDESLSHLADALRRKHQLCPVNWVDEDLEYAAEGIVSLGELPGSPQTWNLAVYHGAVHHYELLWTRLASIPIEQVDDRQWIEWYRRIPLIVVSTPCLHKGVSINVESSHLVHPLLWREIRRMLLQLEQQIGVHTAIEWTERHYTGVNLREVRAKLLSLRDQFRIAIHLDDAGSTGVDTLARVAMVDPDLVKIDGALFHAARHNGLALEALCAHTSTYHRMMIKVVAEWTENLDDIQLASNIGCDYLQGRCFDSPESFEEEHGS